MYDAVAWNSSCIAASRLEELVKHRIDRYLKGRAVVCLEAMLLDARYGVTDLEVNGLELEGIKDARPNARWNVEIVG